MGRSRCRSPGTALRACAPCPRAPARASSRLWGVGASSAVPPQRGGAPARLPAALRTPRQGRVQDGAAEAHAAERRLGGGAWPWACASATRGGWRRRAAGRSGAAGRRMTAWPASPQRPSVPRRGARPSLTSGGAPGRSPRPRMGVWGPGGRSEAQSRSRLRAVAAPGGRGPGRRPAVTRACAVPAHRPSGPAPGGFESWGAKANAGWPWGGSAA